MNKMIYGTFDLSADKIKEGLKTAIKAGYDVIDCAHLYGNEKEIGIALEELKEEGIERLPLQSKIWVSQMDKGTTKEALMNTLKDLRIDKIEYYMIHRPHFDMNKNVQVWKDLIELKKEGLIDHIGVSNFDKGMLRILERETGILPEFNQIEVSVQNLREDRLFINKEKGITVQGWSVMGDVQKNISHPIVQKIAKTHNVDPSLLVIAFVLNLGVDAIVKSATPSRIISNLEAKDIKLSQSEMSELKTINSFTNKFEETFAVDDDDFRKAL